MDEQIAKCPRCSGEGFLRVHAVIRDTGAPKLENPAYVRCPRCAGSGYVDAEPQQSDIEGE
jgi:DnaJ-class molecular chaperone